MGIRTHGGKRPGSGRKEDILYRRSAWAIQYLKEGGISRRNAERVIADALFYYTELNDGQRRNLENVIKKNLHEMAIYKEASLGENKSIAIFDWRQKTVRIKTPDEDKRWQDKNSENIEGIIAEKEETEKVLQWLNAGLSPEEIWQKKGVEKQRVELIVNEYLIDKDSNESINEEREKILRNLEDKIRKLRDRIRHHARFKYSWDKWKREWEEKAKQGPIFHGPELMVYVAACEPMFPELDPDISNCNPDSCCKICGKSSKDSYLTIAHWMQRLSHSLLKLQGDSFNNKK